MSLIRGRFQKEADEAVSQFTASLPLIGGYILLILPARSHMLKCWPGRELFPERDPRP